MYIQRFQEPLVRKSLTHFPVTAVVGPRQCGKSTLVRQIISTRKDVVYLDLERPSDIEKLSDAEWFFQSQRGKLICLDEVQRKKDLFPLIRSLTDEWEGNGHFLITGSATPELLRQSSESLAGRISYHYLSPFIWDEIQNFCTVEEYVQKGGFPKSLLTKDDELSMHWRENFIVTFLERDLSFWSGFSTITMRRLWQMLAHINGQVVNYSSLGKSLGISHSTIRNYIDLLEATFMVKLLPPYFSNLGKRIVKAPKVYITDTGIVNALLGIDSFDKAAGHPVFGSLWESVLLTNLKAQFSNAGFYYYRSSHGAEIDIVLEYKGKVIAIECKNKLSPTLSKGNYNAIEDINPVYTCVVAPVKEGWPMKKGIDVVSLDDYLLKSMHC